MRDRLIGLKRYATLPTLIAVTVIAAGAAFMINTLSTHTASKDAKSAKSDSKTAKRRSTGAAADTLIIRNRLSQMGRCLLRKGLTTQARAKCINLTLPVAQRGLPGLAGQQGRPGATGPQGLPGGRGPIGPRGPPGAVGKQGDPGTACLASIDPGCVGPKGDVGDKGTAGDAGPAGERGPKGDIGGTGPAGEKGVTGDTGPQGATGDPGPAGPQGPPGATGPTGATGATGPAITSFTFSFVDGAGNQQTMTCTDPEGDLTYACQ